MEHNQSESSSLNTSVHDDKIAVWPVVRGDVDRRKLGYHRFLPTLPASRCRRLLQVIRVADGEIASD